MLAEPALPVAAINYAPALAPSVAKIYAEVYGIRYGEPEAPPVEWSQLWAARSPDAWQRLAAEFGFGYVVTPDTLVLKLPVAVRAGGSILYKVPCHGANAA